MNSENLEFQDFPKMARLSREIIITEKIDGTNAQILITENGDFLTGSRTRWITPQDDNFGFLKLFHHIQHDLCITVKQCILEQIVCFIYNNVVKIAFNPFD